MIFSGFDPAYEENECIEAIFCGDGPFGLLRVVCFEENGIDAVWDDIYRSLARVQKFLNRFFGKCRNGGEDIGPKGGYFEEQSFDQAVGRGKFIGIVLEDNIMDGHDPFTIFYRRGNILKVRIVDFMSPDQGRYFI